MNGLSSIPSLPKELQSLILSYSVRTIPEISTVEKVCKLWHELAKELWKACAIRHIEPSLLRHSSLQPCSNKKRLEIASRWKRGLYVEYFSKKYPFEAVDRIYRAAAPLYFPRFGDYAYHGELIDGFFERCEIVQDSYLIWHDGACGVARVQTEHQKPVSTVLFRENHVLTRSPDSIRLFERRGQKLHEVLVMNQTNKNRKLFFVGKYALSLGNKCAFIFDIEKRETYTLPTHNVETELSGKNRFKLDISQGKLALMYSTFSRTQFWLVIWDYKQKKVLQRLLWNTARGVGSCPFFLRFHHNVLVGVIKGENRLYIWDSQTGQEILRHPLKCSIKKVECDGTKIVVSTGSRCKIIDFAPGARAPLSNKLQSTTTQ